MTSPISAVLSESTTKTGYRRAFTLVEMLIVLLIIVLMTGVLMPLIVRAARKSYLMRQYADIQTICQALEAYKSDNGDYPRTDPTKPYTGTNTGPVCLANALVTPGKTRTYLQPRYYYSSYPSPPSSSNDWRWINVLAGKPSICDMWNTPIAYYPAKPRRLINFASFHISDVYDPTPNDQLVSTWSSSGTQTVASYTKLEFLLGDKNGNGVFVAPEAPAYTGPYLIWSAGPDLIFGPVDTSGNSTSSCSFSDMSRSDDVTNFWPGPWPATPNPGTGQ